MRVEIHLHSRAEENLSQAYRYYENESPGLGKFFIESFEQVLKHLSEYPELYAKCYGEVRRGLIKHFPYGVFYLYELGEVVILNVLNTRSDIEAMFS
jgi:toxin ParE1/3/4